MDKLKKEEEKKEEEERTKEGRREGRRKVEAREEEPTRNSNPGCCNTGYVGLVACGGPRRCF